MLAETFVSMLVYFCHQQSTVKRVADDFIVKMGDRFAISYIHLVSFYLVEDSLSCCGINLW